MLKQWLWIIQCVHSKQEACIDLVVVLSEMFVYKTNGRDIEN